MQTLFISCDWGTSTFRLRVVDAVIELVLAETLTQQGIAATFSLWKEQQSPDRFLYYNNYLKTQIAKLEENYGSPLNDVPIIISGMASSAIGMKELPYKQIPVTINPENLLVDITAATPSFPHTIILVSGISSFNDVMRGEETILAGCPANTSYRKQLFILPGTHSKHIIAEEGILTGFKTFMTGELFDLLSTKSILSASVEKGNSAMQEKYAFLQGIHDAQTASLLNTIFHVRTNTIFNRLDRENNYAYLSGLVIGEELNHIQDGSIEAVTIVSSGSLLQLYHTALLSLNKNYLLHIADADKALIKAQAGLFRSHH